MSVVRNIALRLTPKRPSVDDLIDIASMAFDCDPSPITLDDFMAILRDSDCDVFEAEVRQALDALVSAGYVERIKRHCHRSNRTALHYRGVRNLRPVIEGKVDQ